ncbi:unnamed protein product [Urochloa humidicola]
MANWRCLSRPAAEWIRRRSSPSPSRAPPLYSFSMTFVVLHFSGLSFPNPKLRASNRVRCRRPDHEKLHWNRVGNGELLPSPCEGRSTSRVMTHEAPLKRLQCETDADLARHSPSKIENPADPGPPLLLSNEKRLLEVFLP